MTLRPETIIFVGATGVLAIAIPPLFTVQGKRNLHLLESLRVVE
jgi:hypothetical protein